MIIIYSFISNYKHVFKIKYSILVNYYLLINNSPGLGRNFDINLQRYRLTIWRKVIKNIKWSINYFENITKISVGF